MTSLHEARRVIRQIGAELMETGTTPQTLLAALRAEAVSLQNANAQEGAIEGARLGGNWSADAPHMSRK